MLDCLKKKNFDIFILASVTYGAETWVIAKRQENKLPVAQWSMERAILNSTRQGRTRNAIIRETISS